MVFAERFTSFFIWKERDDLWNWIKFSLSFFCVSQWWFDACTTRSPTWHIPAERSENRIDEQSTNRTMLLVCGCPLRMKLCFTLPPTRLILASAQRESKSSRWPSVTCLSNIQSPSISELFNKNSLTSLAHTSSLSRSLFMEDAIDFNFW